MKNNDVIEACSSCFAVPDRVLRLGSGEEIGAWVRASSLVKKSAPGFVLRRGLVKKSAPAFACSSVLLGSSPGFVGAWNASPGMLGSSVLLGSSPRMLRLEGFTVDSLANLTSLVSFNAYGFLLPGPIPDWFGQRLNALQVLDLRSSLVTVSIPLSLGGLSTLRYLYLSGVYICC
nr:putative lrr receptor-like serine/threonine-protein kinase [Quercus suber]